MLPSDWAGIILAWEIYVIICDATGHYTLLVPKHQAVELVHLLYIFFRNVPLIVSTGRMKLAHTTLLGFLYICVRCLWFELTLFYCSLHLLVGHQKLTEDGDCQEKHLLCGTVLWLLPSEPCMWPWYVLYLSCILINSIIFFFKKEGVILHLVHCFFSAPCCFCKLASYSRFLAVFIVILVILLRNHLPMFNIKAATVSVMFFGSSFFIS